MLIFKIATKSEWADAVAKQIYHGSEADKRDGFIHFSSCRQLSATARKHFSGMADLVLVAFESEALGPALRWEPSRGGDLFPHLYAPLETRLARWMIDLPLDDDGVPVIPEGIDPC